MTCANPEVQKIQCNNVDKLNADHDLDQDQFKEIEVDAGILTMDTEGPTSDILRLAPSTSSQPHATLHTPSSMSLISSQWPPRKSIPSAYQQEPVWKFPKNEKTASLKDIAHQFQIFLLSLQP